MIIKGKVHRYADNINTDEIIPARYLNTTDPAALGSHCLEDLDKNFTRKVRKGDILVVGKNFGCGSSREHAVVAIKAAGVSAIVAESYARIFFRNAINTGLAVFVAKEISGIKNGDTISINTATGEIRNLSDGKIYYAEPMPPFLQEIINSGGLIPYVTRRKKKASAD